VATSRGLSGGHAETEGISAQGKVVEVGEHAHAVEMDLTRYELGVARTFDETWDAYLRVPYFVKEQRAEVVGAGGLSAEGAAAARRSGYSHHRTEVYEGFSDLELGVGWRCQGPLGLKDAVLRVTLGLTVPTGATEEDPLRAGDMGLKHLHVQFGNGTFDPLVDFYLGVPVNEHWALGLYGRGRLPLYENGQGYRGSAEGTLMPRVTWLPLKKLSLSAGLAASCYGYAEWSGRRDPNSGQALANAMLSAGYKWNEALTTSLNVLLPVWTKSFSDEDVLDPAPTISVAVGWTF
jgi:hypothetical protein